MNLNSEFFFDLERRLKDAGLDSDNESFDVIKKRLMSRIPLSADDFAFQVMYVILAGGFSQKTAKKIHAKVMDYILNNPAPKFDDLIKFLNNKNKMNAIIKVWENRQKYRDGYYQLANADLLDAKLKYLSALPHIGKITANHLARNLGEDIVKYDIWIQRLGVAFSGRDLHDKIDNGNLDADVKAACDEMFAHLVQETGLPRGYIDVVLWKGLQ
ncbi:MAG: hypothetical protein FWG18_03515, partial [Alphaproteobacteria bacterium]|nr:hypothetical protein [Alphaproteobacteria bacterium]